MATVLKELESVGISTFQTGVDNFRNIVTSSFDGLGEQNLLTCKPFIEKMQEIFLKQEDWIGTLPRKFNTGILGATINDCNIYGHDCAFILAKKGQELGFNLYLGGKVGVQAEPSGLFISTEQVLPTYNAIIELFKKYGFRDNRNKNRLHFLLEAVGMENFVKAIKEYTNLTYQESGEILSTQEFILDESGTYTLDKHTKAVHFSVPSGIFKGSDMLEAGKIAQKCSALIRLSVEQSFYLVCENEKVEPIKSSNLFTKYSGFLNSYFNHQVACAGTATCSFGVIPNKPDAIELATYLSKELPLPNAKIRMYWSACPKGCGNHGIADIGFEGCIAKDEEGNKVDGVHIYLGGKATKSSREARAIYKAIPLAQIKPRVKNLLAFYKENRILNETFESFDTRVLSDKSVEEIQSIMESGV